MKKGMRRGLALVLVLALAAPAWAASPPAGAAIEAALDELVALLKAKDYPAFVERMTPPKAEERKKDWERTKREMVEAYSGGTPKEQQDMLDTFVSMKGKTWTVAPDGKSATVKFKAKDAAGKEIDQDSTMFLDDGKWYMK